MIPVKRNIQPNRLLFDCERQRLTGTTDDFVLINEVSGIRVADESLEQKIKLIAQIVGRTD